MNTRKPGRPLSLPQRPRESKAETQAGDAWGVQATFMLKEAMAHRGWRFRELSNGLALLGVVMTPAAINRRVNRGNFSAGFLLMCLEALQAEVDIQWREWSDNQSTPKTLPRTSGRTKKPVEVLEDIVGGWGANKAKK